MSSKPQEIVDAVRALTERAALDQGVEVVEVVFRRQGRHTLVRVDVDRAGVPGVSLADCERVSRALEALLDEADLFQDSYELQVSSPGLERPIRSQDDVRRNTGRRVRVETREPVEGRHVFSGVLEGMRDGVLLLRLDDGSAAGVPLGSVSLARQELELGGRR
jgi:ribosome maturation factor RimP